MRTSLTPLAVVLLHVESDKAICPLLCTCGVPTVLRTAPPSAPNCAPPSTNSDELPANPVLPGEERFSNPPIKSTAELLTARNEIALGEAALPPWRRSWPLVLFTPRPPAPVSCPLRITVALRLLA